MKKFWKTTLAVAMSAFMAASLAACGGGSSSSSAPANTESEAPSGAIKIGGSGPLTGPAAVYGNAVKTAAEMAVEEVNAKGGVQFELQFEDDKHDAEEAATAFGTLMDGKMQISLATRQAHTETFSRCASPILTRAPEARPTLQPIPTSAPRSLSSIKTMIPIPRASSTPSRPSPQQKASRSFMKEPSRVKRATSTYS